MSAWRQGQGVGTIVLRNVLEARSSVRIGHPVDLGKAHEAHPWAAGLRFRSRASWHSFLAVPEPLKNLPLKSGSLEQDGRAEPAQGPAGRSRCPRGRGSGLNLPSPAPFSAGHSPADSWASMLGRGRLGTGAERRGVSGIAGLLLRVFSPPPAWLQDPGASAPHPASWGFSSFLRFGA